jgi:hypothetical protein
MTPPSFAHWQAKEIALFALSFVYPGRNQRIGGIEKKVYEKLM